MLVGPDMMSSREGALLPGVNTLLTNARASLNSRGTFLDGGTFLDRGTLLAGGGMVPSRFIGTHVRPAILPSRLRTLLA